MKKKLLKTFSIKRVFIASLIAIVVISIGSVVWVFSLSCDSRESHVVRSPTGEFVVQLRQSGCGATTPTFTDVVLKKDSLYNKLPFIDSTLLSYKGYMNSITLEWVDEYTLKICSKIPLDFEKKQNLDKIKIIKACN